MDQNKSKQPCIGSPFLSNPELNNDEYISDNPQQFTCTHSSQTNQATQQQVNYLLNFMWVDELEKAFTGIGGGTASAGSEITSRLFGYFLTWMQEKTKPVFVLTTANDVSALPPELLRKGRFDEIFYVDFPNQSERAEILKVHLKKRKKDGPRTDVKQLARQTDGFSGADLEGVVKDAIEDAFLEGEAELGTSHLLGSIEKNTPHATMMKGKAEEYRKKFKEMRFRKASV